MKRFLSIILTLAMLIAPVGAASCFAAGKTPEEVHMDFMRIMREQRLGKVRVIAALLDDGTMNAQLVYFGKDGRFLKSVGVDKEGYEDLKKEFENMNVLRRLRRLKLSVAHLVYESDAKGNSSINIYYLDSKGRIEYTEYED